MKSSSRLVVALLFVLVASPAIGAPGVNLRWTNCFGDGGTLNRNFACNVNTGNQTLVVSFEPGADIAQVTGITAVVDITSSSTVLPAWWQFKNAGTCRLSSLSVNGTAPFTGVNCYDWSNGQAVAGLASYVVGARGTNTARATLSTQVPASALQDLFAGQEYFAFNFKIDNLKTMGTPTCSGCSTPVCIYIRSITIYTQTTQITLTGPTNGTDSDVATWQGAFLCSASCPTYYRDADGDGYGSTTDFVACYQPASGYLTSSGDCNDADAAIHPGAVELCNAKDDDCDGKVDEVAQAPNLEGWWAGEGNAVDGTGNHNATFSGGSYGAGEVGQSFTLSGTSFVQVPDSPSLRFTNQCTLEGWIRPTDLSTSRLVFSKWSSAAGNWAYRMGQSPGGALHFDVSGDGSTNGGGVLTSPASVLVVNGWSHVAATFDGGAQRLYVNGNLVASQLAATASIFAGATDLFLGQGAGGVERFTGWIDEAAVYGRALTASEIHSLYQAGAGGRCALAGVTDPGPTSALEFSVAWPNPSSRRVNVAFRLQEAAGVRLGVFDLAGRRVSALLRGEGLAAGPHSVAWDGRDDSGREVAPGIYEVRIVTDAGARSLRIVRVR